MAPTRANRPEFTSQSPDEPSRAQAAKEKLSLEFAERPWCHGIGIAPGDSGNLALRVNVAPEALAAGLVLPKQVDGFEVQVVSIEGYEKRPGTKSKRSNAEQPTEPPPEKKPAAKRATKAEPKATKAEPKATKAEPVKKKAPAAKKPAKPASAAKPARAKSKKP